MPLTPVGDVCVQLGFLSPLDLNRILARLALGRRNRFGELAVEMGLLDEAHLAVALAHQQGLNFIPDALLERIVVPADLLARLPRALMRRHLVLPIRFAEASRTLTVVMADPADLPAIRVLQRQVEGGHLRIYVGTRRGVRSLLDRGTGPSADRDVSLIKARLRGMSRVGAVPVRTIVLEPDAERRDLLRRLDRLEGARTDYADDSEQISAFLRIGTIHRLVYRSDLHGLVEPYLDSWRRLQPDLELCPRGSFGMDGRSGPDSVQASRFLVDLLVMAVLATEQKDMTARNRLRRTIELARAVAMLLGLPSSQVDAVVLATLLVEMESLTPFRVLIPDSDEAPGRGRLAVARTFLDAFPGPFDLATLLDVLERRMGGGGPIGAHLGAEVVYTIRAVVRRADLRLVDPIALLGPDVVHHAPSVLDSLGDYLKWETENPELVLMNDFNGEVLVALSDTALHTALELELKALGYHVVVANDGQEVLHLCRVRNPGCVVADYRLPRLTGYYLLGALKHAADTREVPVLFVMEPQSGNDAADAIELGAEDVMIQPVNARLLVSKVRRILSRPRLGDSTGLKGRLSDLPLPDLVQTLTLGGRTAGIDVEVGDHKGQLFIVRGQIYAASFGELRAEAALRELITLKEGTFQVAFGAIPEHRDLFGPSEWLLLEALRVEDEAVEEASSDLSPTLEEGSVDRSDRSLSDDLVEDDPSGGTEGPQALPEGSPS